MKNFFSTLMAILVAAGILYIVKSIIDSEDESRKLQRETALTEKQAADMRRINDLTSAAFATPTPSPSAESRKP